jgi:D-beta-D-heptose 7-phosphate kinase/D-beta-D-heptose 1-phosphate adenosyltransferase
MLRVDTESRQPLAAPLEAELIRRIAPRLTEFAAVLISDYGKGVCSPRLLRGVIDGARAAGIPVVVDPIRTRDYGPYRGATTLTPNRLEAEMASGHKVCTPADAIGAARDLARRLELEWAIVTLDSDGMAAAWPDGSGRHFPTRKRAVYDITGAGDMVLAMLGVCLAGGASVDDAIRLGNVAGGLEVEQVGVVALSREEIRRDLIAMARSGAGKIVGPAELASLAAAARSRGKRIVFTNGCFDLLHAGHVAGLAEAAIQGDRLVVGLNSDSSVRRLKGPDRPIIPQAERAAMLAALASVDYVVVFEEDTPLELIRQLRPDVLVKGTSYAHRPIAGQEFVESYGGRVHLAREIEGWSTTALLERLSAGRKRLAA